MKKIIGFIGIITVMLLMSLTAFAGSIPEDLMNEDNAKIFFAEIVSYSDTGETLKLEYSATKKIKGDVELETITEAYRPNLVGDFNVEIGKEYLFTYFDKNNDTDIFDVTSTDTATLKLKNTTGDMWERFEEYLNDGKYEDAEAEREDRLGLMDKLIDEADTTIPSETSTANTAKIFVAICIVIFVTAFSVGFIFTKKKRR